MTGNEKGRRLIVSACLLGVKCNYKAAASADFLREPLFSAHGFEVIPVCPEQLGGLPTPRIPSELVTTAAEVLTGSGKVLARDGRDVTACFLGGAAETLRLAQILGVEMAVLKSRSPSCGTKYVYDGTFTGVLIPGRGVTAQALLDNGIKVLDEVDFMELLKGTF